MIPLWLTPKVIKGSLITLLIVSLLALGFWQGYRVQEGAKNDLRLQRDTIKANYTQCVDINIRAADSVRRLEASLASQSAAITKMAEDGQAELKRLKARHAAALKKYKASTQSSIEDLEVEKNALIEKMKLLTVAESCHESWAEVVK